MNSIEEFFKGNTPVSKFDESYMEKAKVRQTELTKPLGSLGKLEEIAIWMAGWQKKVKPTVKSANCLIFAGNHGVAQKGVSAYPSEVTVQMVQNFKNGGAAINQLCSLAGLELSVIPLDLDKPTNDFSEKASMSRSETLAAIQCGYDSVSGSCDFLVLGEIKYG